MKMQLLCPKCSQQLDNSQNTLKCPSGHKFNMINNIIDLLPEIEDSNLLAEEVHWDNVAEKGEMILTPSNFINRKILEDCCSTYKKILEQQVPDYGSRHFSIGEIGCGDGSIFKYFPCVQFESVDYIGIDVSLKLLQKGISREIPSTWNTKFVRASSNSRIFSDAIFDMVYCAAALHHLDYTKALSNISTTIKKGGLLIINEPSLGNPFARIGRKLARGFHTPGEKPLVAKSVKKAAERSGLDLIYEKGFYFLNGPLEFLLGFSKVPRFIEASLYYLFKHVDKLIVSPYWSYLFIQAYKKR